MSILNFLTKYKRIKYRDLVLVFRRLAGKEQAIRDAAQEIGSTPLNYPETLESMIRRQLLPVISRLLDAAHADALKPISDTLKFSTTRYSRDRGEPEPTPAFPVEVVFSMKNWQKVLKAITVITERTQVD